MPNSERRPSDSGVAETGSSTKKAPFRSAVLPCLLALASISSSFGANNTVYRIRNSVVVHNNGDILTKLVIIMPMAQTDLYQTVNNVSFKDGEIVDIKETGDKYIRWTITGNLPRAGKSAEIHYDFEATTHAIDFDFGGISGLYPYDTSSSVWKLFTGNSGEFVDTGNPTIRRIGDSIGVRSKDMVDYARRCYMFVSSRYSYLNPNTGIHPLQEILNAGGGDCGNLTSIYVSLLRYRKIPSRHIVAVRLDGSYHVWADFYLEKYGWIPVDVTYKNSNPSGDYFGKYDGSCIVMTRGVGLTIDRGDGSTYNAGILQNYHWWYWCSSAGNDVLSSHSFVSQATALSICADASERFSCIRGRNDGETGIVKIWQRCETTEPFNLLGRRVVLKTLRYKTSSPTLLLVNIGRCQARSIMEIGF